MNAQRKATSRMRWRLRCVAAMRCVRFLLSANPAGAMPTCRENVLCILIAIFCGAMAATLKARRAQSDAQRSVGYHNVNGMYLLQRKREARASSRHTEGPWDGVFCVCV